MESRHEKYLPSLLVLFFLFIFRVLAQLIQKVYPLEFLPNFSAWYSGAIPYPFLFAIQLIIILALSYILRKFHKKAIKANRKLGKVLTVVGSIYFAVMLLRLFAGLTFASKHYWLGATIPAFFHLVLSSFLLILGHFHLKSKNDEYKD